MIQRILFLVPTGQLGGAERCLADTIWSLNLDRPDIRKTLVCGSDGPLVAAVSADQTEAQVLAFPASMATLGDSSLNDSKMAWLKLLVRISIAIPGVLLYLIRLRRVTARLNPDIVFVIGLKMQLLSLVAVPRRVAVVWNVQDYIGNRRLVSRIIRLMMRLNGRNRRISAGCCSDDVCEDLRSVFPDGQFRTIETVYNSVDTDQFRPDGSVHEVLEKCNKVRIGMIGTYARWKGQDLFLRVLRQLSLDDQDPSWHGVIIGGPIYATTGSQWSLTELTEMAKEYEISERVTFLSFQKDPASIMRGLDILVHASVKPEPFGRVIAEGMACGCAVVAVNSGGSAEVFENNKSGMGYPINDAGSLADTIRRLVDDPDLRDKIAQQSIATSSRRFDRKNLCEQWISIMKQTNV